MSTLPVGQVFCQLNRHTLACAIGKYLLLKVEVARRRLKQCSSWFVIILILALEIQVAQSISTVKAPFSET